jgi:hypothetical protein
MLIADIHGYKWKVMDINGYEWISLDIIDVKGY